MIYYSHVNEDNHAEKAIMDRSRYDSLFAIAGSGERVISLMAHPHLENIHSIDLNKEALYLLELKLAALSALEVPEYLEFTGYTDGKNCRASLFREFRNQLTEECKYYWDNHIDYIDRGV
ncbi:MAG: BtaA family protein, partial [Bacteroidia bacterium]|nr:BtaA family protein [Bacteroidia bacterium]